MFGSMLGAEGGTSGSELDGMHVHLVVANCQSVCCMRVVQRQSQAAQLRQSATRYDADGVHTL